MGVHKSLQVLPFLLPRGIPWQPGTLEGRPYRQGAWGWSTPASSKCLHKRKKNKISKVRTSHWPDQTTDLPLCVPMVPIGLFKQPDAASPRTVLLTLALQSCQEGSRSPCSRLACGAKLLKCQCVSSSISHLSSSNKEESLQIIETSPHDKRSCKQGGLMRLQVGSNVLEMIISSSQRRSNTSFFPWSHFLLSMPDVL